MQKRTYKVEEIELLIVDFLKGEITGDEISILNNWLSESEQHIKQFNTTMTAWIASGNKIKITDHQMEEALSKVKGRLGISKEKQITRPFWTIYKIAASWVIFIVAGGILNHFIQQKPPEISTGTKQTSITAPMGSRSVIELPDGSLVWLNAGSKISYSGDFGNKAREVNLAGEAFFSVKSNKAIPFLVKTTEVTVKALGTKFNVKAYPEEEVTTATLEEGVIEVTSDQNKKVILKPNEMITVNNPIKKNVKKNVSKSEIQKKELKVISNINTEPVTSWKDKTWIIDSQPLGTLAPILERRYNIQISFASEEITKFKFTCKIEDETIEQIMAALELSAPVKYKMERNHLNIMIDNDRINRYRQNTNP